MARSTPAAMLRELQRRASDPVGAAQFAAHALDVASLLTHPNQEDLLTPEEWQAFLDPYLAVQARRDPTLPARVHHYGAIFPMLRLAQFLQQTMARAARGALAGWTINGLPANERMRRHLAAALAWPERDASTALAQLADVQFFPASDEPTPQA